MPICDLIENVLLDRIVDSSDSWTVAKIRKRLPLTKNIQEKGNLKGMEFSAKYQKFIMKREGCIFN
uniref:Uncharacterized protein n=1 Tax=Onchocerca volvulus TaxID=6282 RepID=A0A8R1TJQ3_ONCVO